MARIKLMVTPGSASEATLVPLTLSFTTTVSRGVTSRSTEPQEPQSHDVNIAVQLNLGCVAV